MLNGYKQIHAQNAGVKAGGRQRDEGRSGGVIKGTQCSGWREMKVKAAKKQWVGQEITDGCGEKRQDCSEMSGEQRRKLS